MAKVAEQVPLKVKMAAVGDSRLGGGPDQGELRRQLGLFNIHPLQGAAPVTFRAAQVQEVSSGPPGIPGGASRGDSSEQGRGHTVSGERQPPAAPDPQAGSRDRPARGCRVPVWGYVQAQRWGAFPGQEAGASQEGGGRGGLREHPWGRGARGLRAPPWRLGGVQVAQQFLQGGHFHSLPRTAGGWRPHQHARNRGAQRVPTTCPARALLGVVPILVPLPGTPGVAEVLDRQLWRGLRGGQTGQLRRWPGLGWRQKGGVELGRLCRVSVLGRWRRLSAWPVQPGQAAKRERAWEPRGLDVLVPTSVGTATSAGDQEARD